MNKNTKTRIKVLNAYGAKKEQIRKAAEDARNKKLEDYAEKVLALKPRIDDLIAVANACVKNGISLQPAEVTQRYENGYFISNKQNNLTGFIYREKEGIRLVGIEDAIMTNGDHVTTFVKDCDKECAFKVFLNEFDKFETKFYEFVDEICASISESEDC